MKRLREKLSKILLFLLLLFIPTQLGKHFWFDWSLVLGIRVDYLSPTLYLIDLIWIGIFLINLNKINFKKFLSFKWFLILCFVLINILVAKDWQVAGYRWLRIFQLIWFVWYVAKNKKIVKKFLVYIIPIWIIVEGFLALGQMASGGSLNGFWWWLGERSFNFNTIGIAQMSIVGNGLVRAYGTFSHPNSLAGFLLVGLIMYKSLSSRSGGTLLPLTKGRRIYSVFWWGVMWWGVMGIFLTGSRTIWVLTLVSVIWWWKDKGEVFKNIFWWVILCLGLMVLVFKIVDFNYPINNFLGGWDENGLVKRGQLNLAALEMIKSSPVFGVGAGNFLVNLPEFQKNNQIFWLQPVHNIFLLLISEVGLLGIGILVWFLGNWWAKKRPEKIFWWMLGVIVLSGMVDHYWLTLPQNMWLLALVVGMAVE